MYGGLARPGAFMRDLCRAADHLPAIERVVFEASVDQQVGKRIACQQEGLRLRKRVKCVGRGYFVPGCQCGVETAGV